MLFNSYESSTIKPRLDWFETCVLIEFEMGALCVCVCVVKKKLKLPLDRPKGNTIQTRRDSERAE